MACRFGEAYCNVGVGMGSGWGLRGSSMSNCLLVWLIGILDLDLAPVGGVLASKAPPAHTVTKLMSCNSDLYRLTMLSVAGSMQVYVHDMLCFVGGHSVLALAGRAHERLSCKAACSDAALAFSRGQTGLNTVLVVRIGVAGCIAGCRPPQVNTTSGCLADVDLQPV